MVWYELRDRSDNGNGFRVSSTQIYVNQRAQQLPIVTRTCPIKTAKKSIYGKDQEAIGLTIKVKCRNNISRTGCVIDSRTTQL